MKNIIIILFVFLFAVSGFSQSYNRQERFPGEEYENQNGESEEVNATPEQEAMINREIDKMIHHAGYMTMFTVKIGGGITTSINNAPYPIEKLYGGQFGVRYGHFFNENFGLFSDLEFTAWAQSFGDDFREIRTYSIGINEIAILRFLKTNVKMFVGAGIYLSYMVDCALKSDSGSTSGQIKHPEDWMGRFDLGFIFTAGLLFKNFIFLKGHIGIEIKVGLIDLRTSYNNVNYALRPVSAFITIGMGF